jgi:hypothetical protein
MTDYRSAIMDWAKSQIGSGDRAAYWLSAYGSDPGPKLAWCATFCLAALHAAGVGLEVKQVLGQGIIGPAHLKPTRTPQRGDIGYVDQPFQHHFLFDHIDDKGLIHSIDGNQPDVRERTRRPDQLTAFYSIEPLIPLPEGGFVRGQEYSVAGIEDPPDTERNS